MGQLTKQFGKINVTLPIPHLLNLQIDSYSKFLQEGVAEADRNKEEGLEGVFHTVFPIEDFNKTASLEFVSYEIREPKYDQAECISKGLTYEAPVHIKVRLVVYDTDEATGNRTIRDIKEQGIYFGTLPLMTEKGTFIINGTERVIVNQLQRSPGIIFEHDGGKTHTSRKVLYSCRVIPMRGSWLDFDFDHKDILYVRIDRRRKMPATILFKAMGMSKMDILEYFYTREHYLLKPHNTLMWEVEKSLYRKDNAYSDIATEDGTVLIKAGKPITKRGWRQVCEAGIKAIEVRPDTLDGMFLAEDVIAPGSGEVLAEAADEITPGLLERMREAGIERIAVLHTKGTDTSSSIRDTLMQDRIPDQEKAQEEIYRRLRPSSPPTAEIAASFFDNLFRSPDYYDLSPVGRYKLNQRLGLPDTEDSRTLTDNDILTAIKVLVQLKDSHGPADDIDHLGNRRVRLVGELVENQYRIGLVRMERAIKERMSIQEISTLMPHDLINPKPVAAVLKEFFGTSQLSQFMDQTNSLSEVTHKRRLSALGPGGLTRERAGFEVRDVHTSHYGRICPIETPEGPNIGLIVSLTTFAKVNDFGFIETPYRVVRNGRMTDEIVHLDASREGDQVVAQANARVDADGNFLDEFVTVRVKGEVEMRSRDEVTLMDISPSQMVSISAALIPFLEHDDANRALMGSNMQRQAVPLLRSEKPLVGTGMEIDVARDSGACIVAQADGKVEYADADRIVVSYEGDLYKKQGGVRAYDLLKFHKSNQNSCFGQKPTCYPGQVFKKGEILADGPGIDEGQLALGKNLVVAFMPWCGYNYEDSILISERTVKEDIFTSIHIEEFEVVARDTKLGPEEITRDIPNVSEDMLRNLDDSGMEEREIPGGVMVRRLKLSNLPFQVDRLVSVPVIKTHMYAGVTLSVKNMKGCLYQKDKTRLHRLSQDPPDIRKGKCLDYGIVDLMKVCYPDYVVVDGIVAMEGFGPSGGTPVDLGMVLASDDALSADLTAVELMGMDRDAVPHLNLLREDRGLALEEIHVFPPEYRTWARRFRLATEHDLHQNYPNPAVADRGACSACHAAVVQFFRYHHQEFQDGAPATLVLGADATAEDLKCPGPVLVGNCTARLRGQGAPFCKGCPPVPSQIARTLHAGATLDD